jgi:hypothetical protein
VEKEESLIASFSRQDLQDNYPAYATLGGQLQWLKRVRLSFSIGGWDYSSLPDYGKWICKMITSAKFN